MTEQAPGDEFVTSDRAQLIGQAQLGKDYFTGDGLLPGDKDELIDRSNRLADFSDAFREYVNLHPEYGDPGQYFLLHVVGGSNRDPKLEATLPLDLPNHIIERFIAARGSKTFDKLMAEEPLPPVDELHQEQ